MYIWWIAENTTINQCFKQNLYVHSTMYNWLPNDCHLDLNLLIFGNSTLTNEQNGLVLKKVFDYIRKSERSWLFNVHLNIFFPPTNPHPFNHCIVINVINVLYYSYSPFNLFLSLKFLLFLLSFLLSNFGINV